MQVFGENATNSEENLDDQGKFLSKKNSQMVCKYIRNFRLKTDHKKSSLCNKLKQCNNLQKEVTDTLPILLLLKVGEEGEAEVWLTKMPQTFLSSYSSSTKTVEDIYI